VEEEKIAEISSFLEEMYREGYGYNFIGLCFAAVNKSFPRSKKYYCSEFMSMLFHKFEIRGFDSLPALTQPCDFRNLPGVTSVYSGLMRDYPTKKENDPPMH
jgi:inositol transport system substrate-binding protein